MSKIEKGEAINELESFCNEVAEGIQLPKIQEKVKSFLDFAAKFWHYSWRNQWLIHMQRPNASFCKGYGQWQDLGRYVKAEEKGIRILAPTIVKDKQTKEEKCVGFREVCVFDLSQTEGEEIPNTVKEIGNDLAPLYAKLTAYALAKGIKVEEKDLGEMAGGYATREGVAINSRFEGNSKFTSLVHEIAHYKTHFAENRQDTPREQKEVEAELASYMVSAHFGFKSENAMAYMAGWKATPKGVKEAFGKVRNVAKELIEALEGQSETD